VAEQQAVWTITALVLAMAVTVGTAAYQYEQEWTVLLFA
jgi:hypothetical protein